MHRKLTVLMIKIITKIPWNVNFLKFEFMRFCGRLKKRRHLLSSVSIRPNSAVANQCNAILWWSKTTVDFSVHVIVQLTTSMLYCITYLVVF